MAWNTIEQSKPHLRIVNKDWLFALHWSEPFDSKDMQSETSERIEINVRLFYLVNKTTNNHHKSQNKNSTHIDEIEFWIELRMQKIELESDWVKIWNNDGVKCANVFECWVCMWLMFDFCINRHIHWCHWHYYCVPYPTNNGIKWQFAKFSTPFKLKRLPFKRTKKKEEFNEKRWQNKYFSTAIRPKEKKWNEMKVLWFGRDRHVTIYNCNAHTFRSFSYFVSFSMFAFTRRIQIQILTFVHTHTERDFNDFRLRLHTQYPISNTNQRQFTVIATPWWLLLLPFSYVSQLKISFHIFFFHFLFHTVLPMRIQIRFPKTNAEKITKTIDTNALLL